MKKLFKLTFILLIFLATSINRVSATSINNFKPKYGITTARTNFRNIPSTSSKVLSVLQKGTQVKMVGTIDNFYIIELSNNLVGCISKDYVKETGNALKDAKTYTNISLKAMYITANNVNLRRGPRNFL